jgi:hypothetical protein
MLGCVLFLLSLVCIVGWRVVIFGFLAVGLEEEVLEGLLQCGDALCHRGCMLSVPAVVACLLVIHTPVCHDLCTDWHSKIDTLSLEMGEVFMCKTRVPLHDQV